jgi:Ca-activated chloride channel family protein
MLGHVFPVLLVTVFFLINIQSSFAQLYYAPLSPRISVNHAPSGFGGITLSKRVDEVNLAFTVTDKKGHFIRDLGGDDFQVFDNHLAPERLRFFEQQTNLPLRVALLIDASSSVKYRFQFEQAAAVVFLKKILRPGLDQAFVAIFNDRVSLLTDFTDDARGLARQVKEAKAGGNTVLYDAIVYACDRLRAYSEEQVTRKVVIVISDGDDTASHNLMYDAQMAAVRSEVAMFALSTNDLIYDRYPRGEAVLNLLTRPTGGRILPAREDSQLRGAFRSIETTLRNQYALAYAPPEFKPDGSYRPIELIPRKPKLKVSCRKGYYARREQAKNGDVLNANP